MRGTTALSSHLPLPQLHNSNNGNRVLYGSLKRWGRQHKFQFSAADAMVGGVLGWWTQAAETPAQVACAHLTGPSLATGAVTAQSSQRHLS